MAQIHQVKRGKISNGMQGVEIVHKTGAKAEVALFGATCVSYSTSTGRPVLFVSEKSLLDESKPIRGGIPIVFPQFSNGDIPNDMPNESVTPVIHADMPSHGFARRMVWEIETSEIESANPTVVFLLVSSEYTRTLWPYDFELRLSVSVEPNALKTKLCVTNTSGLESFHFQALQHTYLSVPNDISAVQVSPFAGIQYMDQPENRKIGTWTEECVKISKETDLIFIDAPDKIQIDLSSDPKIILSKTSDSPTDVVVWNPWTEKAAAMSDFKDQEYLSMICVEPGRVSNWVGLESGKSWSLEQYLSVSQ